MATSTVTATPRAPYSGQFLIPVGEENDASVREDSLEEGLREQGDDPVPRVPQQPSSTLHTHQPAPQLTVSLSLPHASDALPGARGENRNDAPATPGEMPARQREQTNVMIPGRSTHRIDFPALAQTSDPATVTPQAEAQQPSPDTETLLHAPVSHPLTREMALSDSELLARVEQLVNNAAKEQRPETQHLLAASRSATGMESMNARGKSGDTNMPQQLAQLQRAVNELTATVLSQATWIRAEEQARQRDRKTPTPRKVAVKRGEARSAIPRAFWERSRLGRLHLRTGR